MPHRRLAFVALCVLLAGTTCGGVSASQQPVPGELSCSTLMILAQRDKTDVMHGHYVRLCVIPELERPHYAPPPAYRQKRGWQRG